MIININETANWKELIKNEKSVALEGIITINDINHIVGQQYDVLDLSNAVFDITTPKEPVSIICHGMVLRGPAPKENNPLLEIVKKVFALTIILPDDVTRKQMNAIIKNELIFEVEVSETCRLYSMKDGNIFTKNSDKLVFEKRPVKYDVCQCCQKSFVSELMYRPFFDKDIYLCQDCAEDKTKFDHCIHCGRLFPVDQLTPDDYYENELICSYCKTNQL